MPAVGVRKWLAVLAIVAGAAAMTGNALAQPYGYYPGPGYYGYRYDPPRAYDAQGRYTPYTYYNGYDGYHGAAGYAAIPAAGLLPGHAPYDAYGPDPNGQAAPDGHRIKCKLVDDWDSYRQVAVRRRECW